MTPSIAKRREKLAAATPQINASETSHTLLIHLADAVGGHVLFT